MNRRDGLRWVEMSGWDEGATALAVRVGFAAPEGLVVAVWDERHTARTERATGVLGDGLTIALDVAESGNAIDDDAQVRSHRTAHG